MIDINDIKDVHLEISSMCNARCPLCPRNFRGYPFNDGYDEVNMTLHNAKKIFSPEFLKQLSSIRINGNFGDIVMNPESPYILDYFKSHNKNLKLVVSTNGSGRNKEFWVSLSKTAEIYFCLDGLSDTHKLYRQNTDWDVIIKNAKIVIKNGGIAHWKFIKFEHNKHQIDACQELSKELGFESFKLIDHGRNTGPVFDQNGQLVHILGNYTGPTEFPILFNKKTTDLVLLEDIVGGKVPKSRISCQTKNMSSIYISSTGDVYPCCFTGFNPRKFGHGEYHQAVNEQIKNLLPPSNNALENPLESCIKWFNKIENSWKQTSYEAGRLVVCDDVCGSN